MLPIAPLRKINMRSYVKLKFELQIFYERMLSAKNNSIDEEKRQMASKGSNSPDLYSR